MLISKNDSLTSLLLLWECLATQIHQIRMTDLELLRRRTEGEGIRFLTTTLPSLGKDVDRALILGEPLLVTGRFRLHPNSVLPEFLYDLFIKVFRNDGVLRAGVNPRDIKVVRQLTLMYYKLEVEYDEETIDSYFDSYCSIDTGLDGELPCGSQLFEARRLVQRVLGRTNPRNIRPRHGSGATACRTKNSWKYHTFRYLPKIDDFFGYSEMFFYNATHLSEELDKLLGADVLHPPVGRIIAIPKDSRGPRLICMEPREQQYIQQGLMRMMYDIIESHHLTAGYVNFTDQSVNRELARLSSITGDLATLDLSEASDRVRWDLVKVLFPRDWIQALDACRTEYVQFPSGRQYGPLRKFASMGSAVCFPVESLVFWALLKGGIGVDVFVYGDDLILPTACVEQAISILEAVSLKVNVSKSCYLTSFRESCGGEYFNGTDVGYVKVRRVADKTIEAHTSFVDFVNEIFENYGEKVGHALRGVVDDLYGPHFCTLEELPLTYRCSNQACNDVFFNKRWSKPLQKYEYRIPVVRSKSIPFREKPKFHWCELLRYSLTNDNGNDSSHITSDGSRPRVVGSYTEGHSTIKYAWRGDL